VRAWLLELRRSGVRVRGVRRPDEWVEGFVSFRAHPTRCRSFDCMVFRRVMDPHPMPNWRELYEPRIMSIGGGSLWIRGFERQGDAALVQEWRLDCQRAVAPGGHVGPPLGEVPSTR
jgi:hypothetical protein